MNLVSWWPTNMPLSVTSTTVLTCQMISHAGKQRTGERDEAAASHILVLLLSCIQLIQLACPGGPHRTGEVAGGARLN